MNFHDNFKKIQNKIKTFLAELKYRPYLSCCICGGVLLFGYAILNSCAGDLSQIAGIFVNIGCALMTVPILYLVYDKTKRYSYKKNNLLIYKYTYENIIRELDKYIESILFLVLPNYHMVSKEYDINWLLKTDNDELIEQIKMHKYFGGQIHLVKNIQGSKLIYLMNSNFIFKHLEELEIAMMVDIAEVIEKIKNLVIRNDFMIIVENGIEKYKCYYPKLIREVKENTLTVVTIKPCQISSEKYSCEDNKIDTIAAIYSISDNYITELVDVTKDAIKKIVDLKKSFNEILEKSVNETL